MSIFGLGLNSLIQWPIVDSSDPAEAASIQLELVLPLELQLFATSKTSIRNRPGEGSFFR